MSQAVFVLFQSLTVILFFAAAVFASRARNGSLLALGLTLLGVEAFIWALLNWLVSTGAIEFGSAYRALVNLNRVISLVGILALVAGARRLSGGKARAPLLRFAKPKRTYLPPSDTAMESLIIPRNSTNSFTRAEALRDQLYERIERECQRAGLQVIGYKSHDQSGTVWLRFDYMLPQDTENLSLRASLKIMIERFDYHRFEHVYTLDVTQGIKAKTRIGYIELTDPDIRALNSYLSAGGTFPSLASRRIRMWPLQLWRPPNKVDQLRPDWLTIAAALGIIIVIPIPFGPLLAIVGGLLLWRFTRTRRTYILTTGKPLHDPRQLVRMDSWQTTIDKLALRNDEVREALIERLRSSADKGIQIQQEHIWYPGVDGKVERQQVVCTFRRAIGFLHLEPYGNDLYVGWDSHVNCGTWVEETLARGVDRESGKLVVANRVVPGWQAPNEYDITDVNYMTEWLHAAIVRVVRLKIEEHRIDQEIDFTIQRESRKAALTAEEPAALAGRGGLGGLASRLRRVA